ncbi:MAG: putative phosphoribosyl transferase [Solirubrobacteraceae bacterium]|jgi:pimeloyl-ACP methyl ester carboxylesterase|nr:putative phosphoribosyl transferase [Solirubrobacteraceae bacterium]
MVAGHGERGDVAVPAGGVSVAGTLTVPPGARGVVVFAHGRGSGRFSRRNRAVAGTLVEAGLATLLLDLLTEEEEQVDARSARIRFDARLLAARVVGAIDWLALDAVVGDLPPALGRLPVGVFGASTGAAAALIASAQRPDRVCAVVSRGGRSDLAADALPGVTAPTLLIAGGRDTDVLDLDRRAQAALGGEAVREVVPGAGHLFEEPGALERVAGLARDWFLRHLTGARPRA